MISAPSPRAGAIRRHPCLLMFFVALAVRLALIVATRSYIFPLVFLPAPFSLGDPHFAFGNEIGSIAHSIATGHGFGSPFGPITGPTAWIGPVYPYMCAAVFKIFGIFTPSSAFVLLFLNSIFSAWTCVPLYKICELTMGRPAALWSSWTWALLPYFLVWPTTVIWETCLVGLLLTYLVFMTLRLADPASANGKNGWLKFGLLWGFALLTNPVLLTFFPVSFLWLAYRRRREKLAYLRPIALTLVICALVISPWLVRNRVVLGHFIFIRSNFGFEFHLGNYHFSNGFGWAGKHPSENKAERELYARLGEVAYIASKRDEAIAFVRQYPQEFLALTGKRIQAFWSGEMLIYGREPMLPWVYPVLSTMTLLGLLAAFRNRLRGAGLFFGLILLYPLPFYIAFPQTRNRHPIEPEMLALSVYFVVAVFREFRGKPEMSHAPSLPVNTAPARHTEPVRA
jgi:Dolichyl-phosphate-mannose-protein mannosyltransferase